MDQHRTRRAHRGQVEVVAHDEVADTHPRQVRRKVGVAAAVAEQLLHAVQRPDVARRGHGDGVAHGPGRGGESLQRLVARLAPQVRAVRRPGHDKGATLRRVPRQPCGRLEPVARHGDERPARGEVPPQRGCGDAGDSRGEPHGCDRRSHAAPAGEPLPHRRPVGQGASPSPGGAHRAAQGGDGPPEPDGDRQPEPQVELVHVPQGRQHAVEEPARGRRECSVRGPPRRGHVRADDGGQPDADADDEESTVPGAAQDEPRHPAHGDDGRRDDERPFGDELPPGRPLGAAADGDVGDPVGDAAQGGGPVRDRGRDRRGLDPVEERRRVATEQEERADEPCGREGARQHPPAQEPGADRARRLGEDPREADGGAGRSGGGVDAAHARDGQGRQRGRTAQRAPRAHRDERDQHPGRERVGQGLHRDGAHRGHHARREGERQAGAPAGQRGPQPHEPGQAHHPQEGDAQQHRPPHPLPGPGGEPELVPEQEERAHGEQVSVRLVLQGPEEALGVPLAQRPDEEGTWILRQVELGVGSHEAGGLREGEGAERDARGEQSQAPGGPRHRPRRPTTTRFQQRTSRRPGTCPSRPAQAGR